MIRDQAQPRNWSISYRYTIDEGAPSTDPAHAGHSGPAVMRMQAHRIEARARLTDRWTGAVGFPLVEMEMQHPGMFDVRSAGIGDIQLEAAWNAWRGADVAFHVQGGLSLPTGSVTAVHDYGGFLSRDPYHMKRGSGTYALRPGVALTGAFRGIHWGSLVLGTALMGLNDAGFRFGDRLGMNLWSARTWSRGISTNLRVTGDVWSDVHGRDALIRIDGALADPQEQAGHLISLGLGLGLVRLPPASNGGIEFELELPISQRVDAGLHETDWRIAASFLLGSRPAGD